MNTLIIDDNKYVVLETSVFEHLQEKAARKTVPGKKLSPEQGRKRAYKQIDKWAKGK